MMKYMKPFQKISYFFPFLARNSVLMSHVRMVALLLTVAYAFQQSPLRLGIIWNLFLLRHYYYPKLLNFEMLPVHLCYYYVRILLMYFDFKSLFMFWQQSSFAKEYFDEPKWSASGWHVTRENTVGKIPWQNMWF